MEKISKIVLPISQQWIETYGKINLVGICSHPVNANWLQWQSEKWAGMGTFNTECIATFLFKYLFFSWNEIQGFQVLSVDIIAHKKSLDNY